MSHPEAPVVERWFMRRGFTALLDGTSMRRRRAARFARTLAIVFVLIMVIEVPRYGSNPWITLPISLLVILPIALDVLGVAVGFDTAFASHLTFMVFGALIVFFLIVEPHGLARLWSIGKEKLRLWPFPH